MTKSSTKNTWHLLLGRLLHLALDPLGIQVLTDVPLLSEAPKADIILLRRAGRSWNLEQRRWLADGLRHTDAGHLLIEFKHSEGLNLTALQQLNAYDYFYRVGSKRKLKDVACFLLVASTPNGDWQQRLGFTATKWPGVYSGTETLSQRVRILLLNELDPTPHNAPIKCFATRRMERDKALDTVRDSGFSRLSANIGQLIAGLRRMYMSKTAISEDLTPELVMKMGREWIDAILDATPTAEFLSRHSSDEVLSHYKPDELLKHCKPDEVLSHYKPDEMLSYCNEDQIRAYLAKLQSSKN